MFSSNSAFFASHLALSQISARFPIPIIDQDAAAIEAAGIRLKDFGEKVTIVRSNYCDMKSQLQGLGIDKAGGIVLDLGVSSYQLDTAERGLDARTSSGTSSESLPGQSLTIALLSQWNLSRAPTQ